MDTNEETNQPIAEARNSADTLIYSIEKSLKEFGEKLDPSTRKETEAAMLELKQAMEGADIAEINRLKEDLTRFSHQLAEKLYRQTSADTQSQSRSESQGRSTSNTKENVVDAEFEEVG